MKQTWIAYSVISITIFILIYIVIYFSFIYNVDKHNLDDFEIDDYKNNVVIVLVKNFNTSTDSLISLRTVKCYCLQNNVSLKVITRKKYLYLFNKCHQKDFMFQRHCIISMFADENQNKYKYIFFIDNNMGIINPKHQLEEYLPNENEEFIFYERVFNTQIDPNTYIFKNTNYSRNFLKFFANFECKHSNDGRDINAIHAVFTTLFGGDNYLNVYNHCMNIWKKAIGYEDNMIFISCMRWILRKLDETKANPNYFSFDDHRMILLKKKSNKTWVRDIIMNSSKFQEQDFFLHDIKNYKDKTLFFKKEFNPTPQLCKSKEYLKAWEYETNAKVYDNTINEAISKAAVEAKSRYQKYLQLSGINKINKTNPTRQYQYNETNRNKK
uniref:Glycosyltransferase n=1 Tax=Parastrongyloides trichosuri TaxID=131310 RepID=A0A0N4ZLP2_PARTI